MADAAPLRADAGLGADAAGQVRHAPCRAAREPSRIGPNAIIQMAVALNETVGHPGTRSLFEAAGLGRYLDTPPDGMVDEREVSTLQAVVATTLGPERAREAALRAGALTGDYLLANRIPRPVQVLLRVLPAPLASRLLLAAIGRHAWTFAGSGRFDAETGTFARISVSGCPICHELTADRPMCAYFEATFERLYRSLVHASSDASEVACEAHGDAACVFEVRWR